MDEMSSKDISPSLESRFDANWRSSALHVSAVDPASVWRDLAAHYSDPRRHYHTLTHLAHCFEAFDTSRDYIEDQNAVELAIWFHDIINDPEAPDNEQRSADRFREVGQDVFTREFIDKVGTLILATRHRDEPEGNDARIISDIDLTSLAAPWDQFIADGAALRQEQPNATDAEYYRAKASFLSSLLERPEIFYSRYFNCLFERHARNNLTRFLADLREQGYLVTD